MSRTSRFVAAALFASSVATTAAQPPRLRVGGDIRPPQKIVHVDPVYPDEARTNRISGMVILEAIIATDGTIMDLKVLRNAHPLLDEAASTAVRQWVYTPTLLNGEPAELIMSVNVTFATDNDQRQGPPPPPPPTAD